MRIGKANISCGAFGQSSVPLLLSRRAHLLTTHKMGGGSAKADVRSPRVASPSEPCGSCRRAVTFRTVACSSTAFSFYEKETKILPERCDLQEWRFII